MGTIWVIRHGETSSGVGETRYCGSSDEPLTPHGHAQAAAIARRLAERPLTAIYVTPLQRTAQTAAPLAAATGLTPRVCPALREIDLGAWEGLTAREITARDPELYARYLVARDQVTPPGGEALPAFTEQVMAGFAVLAARHAEEEIALFSHKVAIRVLLCRLLELPLAHFPRIHQEEGAINRLLIEPRRIVVAGVNDRCHLDA